MAQPSCSPACAAALLQPRCAQGAHAGSQVPRPPGRAHHLSAAGAQGFCGAAPARAGAVARQHAACGGGCGGAGGRGRAGPRELSRPGLAEPRQGGWSSAECLLEEKSPAARRIVGGGGRSGAGQSRASPGPPVASAQGMHPSSTPPPVLLLPGPYLAGQGATGVAQAHRQPRGQRPGGAAALRPAGRRLPLRPGRQLCQGGAAAGQGAAVWEGRAGREQRQAVRAWRAAVGVGWRAAEAAVALLPVVAVVVSPVSLEGRPGCALHAGSWLTCRPGRLLHRAAGGRTVAKAKKWGRPVGGISMALLSVGMSGISTCRHIVRT